MGLVIVQHFEKSDSLLDSMLFVLIFSIAPVLREVFLRYATRLVISSVDSVGEVRKIQHKSI
jgi:hypothetical protein